jgi:aspartate/methionine/tyrosine aminotransferase
MNDQFAAMPLTIFEHMSGLARELGAVNLGQGFPDFGWPEDVVAVAADALLTGSNQYPPMRGLAELRQAVCDHYATLQKRTLQADQVTITSGATEALAAAIMALVSPGDEVVVFEPLYDAYVPMILRCGGIPRFARLTPPDWRLTRECLDAVFTDRVRLVVFNTPHNPTARAFDADELGLLAEACVRHDALAISDEVWEQVVFDGRGHIPLASMPGMAERTVKVGSAGKIFSLTGWKVGWAVAPLRLSRAVANAHQFLTFTTAPNLQAAVAFGLAKPKAHFDAVRSELARSRDFLIEGIRQAGFVTTPVEGTYFVCIDLAASGIGADDRIFCERAVRDHGVAAIPLSPFYDADPERGFVRLCFAKKRATLEAGIARLAAAREAFL